MTNGKEVVKIFKKVTSIKQIGNGEKDEEYLGDMIDIALEQAYNTGQQELIKRFREKHNG